MRKPNMSSCIGFLLVMILIFSVTTFATAENADVGQPNRLLQTSSDGVTSVDWNPDGIRLATTQGDDTVRIWDVRTGELLSTFVIENPEPDPESRADVPDWSPDGSRLVVGSGSFGQIFLIVLDGLTGEPLATIGPERIIEDFEWSPDGTCIAAPTAGGAGPGAEYQVTVWDATTGQVLIEFDRPESSDKLAWSADGTRIATSGSYSVPTIWDVATGLPVLQLLGHEHVILDIDWSPDGSRIATSAQDFTTRIWNATNGDPLLTITHEDFPLYVLWSPDSTRLAIQFHYAVQVFDPMSGEPVSGRIWIEFRTIWSPDSTSLLIEPEEDQGFTILNLFGPDATPTHTAP